MTPARHLRASGTAVGLILLTVLASCYTYRPLRTPYTDYAPGEKIQLKIALNITDELRDATWEKRPYGTFRVKIPVGECIANNAAVLVEHTFAEVVNVRDAEAKVDAILTPKLVYFDATTPPSPWGDSLICVKVEWLLTDPAGNVVWVDTISGEMRGTIFWTSDPTSMFSRAFEDLLTKSHVAMTSSATIRQFAVTKSLAGLPPISPRAWTVPEYP
jgi:Rad3-related DNA helicase